MCGKFRMANICRQLNEPTNFTNQFISSVDFFLGVFFWVLLTYWHPQSTDLLIKLIINMINTGTIGTEPWRADDVIAELARLNHFTNYNYLSTYRKRPTRQKSRTERWQSRRTSLWKLSSGNKIHFSTCFGFSTRGDFSGEQGEGYQHSQ